jgi:hypothetical protein
VFDTGKSKNDDKIKDRPKSRLFMALMSFVVVISGISLWKLLHPTAVFRPEFPASPLLYAIDENYEMINLQTGERTQALQPWFYVPPDSPADILAAQAVIDGWLHHYHKPLVPSPDNQWLVGWKDMKNGLTWELMLYDRYGEGRSRSLGVFNGTHYWRTQVRWSPDSQSIIFSARHDRLGDNQELWLIEIPTGELKRLTNNNVYDGDPDFSPDGTEIVYNASSTTDGSRLYIMNLATGKSRLLTSDLYAHSSVWSPDGQWIAFVAFTPSSNPNDTHSQIRIIRPNGTDAQAVTGKEDTSSLEEDIEWLP